MVWRSVGNSHPEFARESAIDELAIAAGRDPVDLRIELLADRPRTLRASGLRPTARTGDRCCPMAGGLSAAAWGEAVRGEGGETVTQNFDRYPVVRMRSVPQIEIGLIESPEPPTGVGEVAVPSVAPALANAIARAHRHPDLPAPHRQADEDRLGGHTDAQRQHHP